MRIRPAAPSRDVPTTPKVCFPVKVSNRGFRKHVKGFYCPDGSLKGRIHVCISRRKGSRDVSEGRAWRLEGCGFACGCGGNPPVPLHRRDLQVQGELPGHRIDRPCRYGDRYSEDLPFVKGNG